MSLCLILNQCYNYLPLIINYLTFFLCVKKSELAKEADCGAFRGGAITPDGLIDEDFEKELGTPAVRVTGKSNSLL